VNPPEADDGVDGIPSTVESTLDRVADLVVVGGGLAGCLTALAYRKQHRAATIVLLESGPALGGNHTWCCFASDLAEGGLEGEAARRRELLDRVVARRWSSHRVKFPSFERELDGEYLCVTAEKLRSVMQSDFAATTGSTVLTDTPVRSLVPHAVELADGRRIRGTLVVDARGGRPAKPDRGMATDDHAAGGGGDSGGGYQKFLGREVCVKDAPAAYLSSPLVMDATTPQVDGFRFMYCLPLQADHILIEDTCFSNDPGLNLADSRERIATYARQHGLRIERVVREEMGVLPMPGRDESPPGATDDGPGEPIGYRAGLFHSGTGYSLPIAVEIAVALAAGDSAAPSESTAPIRARLRQQNRFFERLNHLMFVGVPAEHRRAIFERFYQLPAGTIERFYGARTTWMDRARLLAGRPPRGFRWREVLAQSVRSRRRASPAVEGDTAETLKEAT
jgi:lycopene beta-cyclase